MRYSIVLVIALSIVSHIAWAEGDATTAVVKAGVNAAFEEFEKQMIYKYFDEHPYHSSTTSDMDDEGHGKKDKGKKKGLPPGIQKKLERGGTMPPGIAKNYLPNDLVSQLPPPPHGYDREIVGNDVLLVNKATGYIADVISDAILGK